MAVTQGYRRIFDDPQVLVRLPHLTGDMRAADFADLWTTSSQDGGVGCSIASTSYNHHNVSLRFDNYNGKPLQR